MCKFRLHVQFHLVLFQSIKFAGEWCLHLVFVQHLPQKYLDLSVDFFIHSPNQMPGKDGNFPLFLSFPDLNLGQVSLNKYAEQKYSHD